MHSRTMRAGEHWRKTHQAVHNQVVELETALGQEPKTSLETGIMVEIAPQFILSQSLMHEAPLYLQMETCFFITNDEAGFVTSDDPCSWYNPNSESAALRSG